MKNPNKHNFVLKEVDLEEVHKLLLKINTKKSSDIFGISTKLIRLSAKFIKGHLNLIFNESFKEGNVSDKLKPAIVHPLYGFQKGKSTEHAILDLYKNVVETIEKKEKACVKAFDTVNHKIMLKNMSILMLEESL